jgi:hypothetical protein
MVVDFVGIELLLDELGRRGVSTYVKFDHERIGFSDQLWTVTLYGREAGVDLRVDSVSLERCFHLIMRRLEGAPGDWSWMEEMING